jgi:hypothetical protein
MNVDYFSVARAGRLIALDSLDRRQPERPGFFTPAASLDALNAGLTAQLDTNGGVVAEPARLGSTSSQLKECWVNPVLQ